MIDTALLVLRLVTGGLLAGHGSQKLFGWFGGYGKEGTKGWLESMGFKPGDFWTYMVGSSEFGGGLLTALGLLGPVGPSATVGAMGTAALTAHRGKPIWVTSGGAELPVTNMAVATALALAGPGKLSLDELLDAHLPRWVAIPTLAGAVGAVVYAVYTSNRTKQLEARQSAETQAQQAAQAGA